MTSGWKYVTKQLVLILVIALLCCLFLAIGLMIGYGIIGEGKNPFAIL
ncbi:DNA-directed RNA polymerase subunit beta, partial [Streptococcus gallolyticus]